MTTASMSESVASSNAKLEKLLKGETAVVAAAEAPKLADVLKQVAAVLEGAVTDKAEVAKVSAALALVMKETAISSTVVPPENDQTVTEVPPGQAATASSVATNIDTLAKRLTDGAAAITKMIGDEQTPLAKAARETLAKAATASDKLAKIKQIFSLGDDVKDYDLRWRISDMVGALQQIAAVDAILPEGSADDAAATAAKADGTATPVSKAATEDVKWPADMSGATYDKKAGLFKREDKLWGHDSEAKG